MIKKHFVDKKLWPYYLITFIPFTLLWLVIGNFSYSCSGAWDSGWVARIFNGAFALLLIALICWFCSENIDILSQKGFLGLYVVLLIAGSLFYIFLISATQAFLERCG